MHYKWLTSLILFTICLFTFAKTTLTCDQRMDIYPQTQKYKLKVSYSCSRSKAAYSDLGSVGIAISNGQEFKSDSWICGGEITFQEIGNSSNDCIRFLKSDFPLILQVRYLSCYVKYGTLRAYGPNNLGAIPLALLEDCYNAPIYVYTFTLDDIFSHDGTQKYFEVTLRCDNPDPNQ